MSTPVLHVEHVTMQFGGVVAVNDLSMDVYDREIVALIGPNGAGKTTAFNCITGVYEPTNGRVDFLGEPIVCNHPHGKMKKIYAGEGAEPWRQIPASAGNSPAGPRRSASGCACRPCVCAATTAR